MTIATIKGALGTSIDILSNTIHQVGDVISFNNITSLIPRDENYTNYFYRCIQFCKMNGSARLFKVDSINDVNGRCVLSVSPIYA